MGILERVNRIVRANVNQILDRAEDPQKSLLLHIEEMRDSVQEARRELVRLGTAEKLARRKHQEALEESRRWEERAMQALRAGDENLARQALQYKHTIDLRADDLLRQAELSAEYVAQLKGQVDMLEQKAELARQRSRDFAARRVRQEAEQAQAWRHTSPRPVATEPLEDTRAFDEFQRIDDRISYLDAEMEAIAELNAELFDPSKAELDRRFRDLEQDQGVTDDLADLKRKLDEK